MSTRTSIKHDHLLAALSDAQDRLPDDPRARHVFAANLVGDLLRELAQSMVPEQRIVDAIERAEHSFAVRS